MSDKLFNFVCTACARSNKTVKAVKYCVECSGYCCQSCTDIHKNLPALGGHNISDITQATKGSSQQSILMEFPTERCSIHKNKVLDMYCEHHDTVGCYVCFVKDHKSCKDSHIHSIPDMIDTIFKLADCKKTHGILKDMIVSMKALIKSKDIQLQTLNKAKKETLDKVMTFQKALEASLRTVAESSRKEVEAAYKKLEKEILQDKHTVNGTCDGLQMADDKLNQSEGNRAQKFVCTKIAEEIIKEADSEKIRKELKYNADVEISFIPNQSLREYIKALQGIGQVQKHGKQKHDLYKIKGSRDININLSNDSNTCSSSGCCLTYDNKLFVTDCSNKKLKRIDMQTMSVVDYCTLDSKPSGVCCISKHEVAIACDSDDKVQFVSIHNKMTATRHIKMSHGCFGIAFNDGKLYVTDYGVSLYVYDVTGTLLKTIIKHNAGNKLFTNNRHITFNERDNRMFVGDFFSGLVCFDGMANYLSTITDTDLKYVNGVCVDGRGNMFVVRLKSHNVAQFSENGKKVGVVVKQGDGLHYPTSVCFHTQLNRLFVTMDKAMKMFELE